MTQDWYYVNASVRSNPIGGASVNFSQNLSSYNYTSDSKSGVKLPSYRRLIANGSDATTAYSRSLTKVVPARIFWSGNGVERSTGRQIRWQLCGLYVTSDRTNQTQLNSSSVESDALTAFWSNYGSDVQAGVMLGEAGETLRMLRHPAKALHGVVHSTRKRLRGIALKEANKRAARRSRHALGDAWLESVFGWDPLVRDTQSALDEYDRYLARVLLKHVAGASTASSIIESYTSKFQFSTMYNSPFFSALQHKHTTKEHGVKYLVGEKLYMDYDSSPIATLRSVLGLDLRSFVPTLWELTPWSFAVDYFTNVGEILNASFGLSSGVVYGCHNVRKIIRSRGTTTYDTDAVRKAYSGWLDIANVDGSPGVHTQEIIVFTRDMSKPTIPSLRLDGPSIRQSLNLLALGSNRI